MEKESKKIESIRHSLSHIMALAIKQLYPETKFGIGPSIENGFYYDFELKEPISTDDLPKIEKKMKEILKKDIAFEKKVIPKKEAEDLFKDQPYKLEIIKNLEEDEVTIYTSGDFTDVCKGPHVQSTKEISFNTFKLVKISGAYWLGNEKNPMLTRIYGVAFESKEKLQEYIKNKEEAEKRDHRVLGKKFELFTFDEEVGPGLPLWLPKGAMLRKLVMDFAFNTYLKRGYEPVSTPHIASLKLWQHSGHLDFYKENLYDPFGVEEEKYMIKPMNCPFHIQMYKSKRRSYRDLPIRWTEMGTVYRYEKSGVLHGLTRVRGFTQDDAHILCTPDQLHQEILEALKLTLYILNTFGFKNFEMNLSVRDPENKEKFIGGDENWEKAEKELKNALSEIGYSNFVYDVGGAVFYGPKIDVKVNDSLGRPWQLSTIQFDFNLPSRFDMNYWGEDGEKHTPFMIHRALLGSLERFIGVLIEHYGGAFPLWLSPEQIWIIPIGNPHKSYAKEIANKLFENDIRIKLKDESETVSKKIREGEIQKIPYLIVIGDKEKENNSVRVRKRGQGDIGEMNIEKFLQLTKKEIGEKDS
jgi:threonyl-tRNA synthetase